MEQATRKFCLLFPASCFQRVDLHKIKQYMKGGGDKFIFVEDGEPSLVVMSFREYERLVTAENGGRKHGQHDFDVVAASFESERMRARQEEVGPWNLGDAPLIPEKRTEHIRLEDLPL
jgi:hypothetical protein